MRQFLVVAMIAVIFLVACESQSASTFPKLGPNQVKPTEVLNHKTSPNHRSLRAVSTAGGNDEERATLRSYIYMALSKLAKKGEMKKLSDKLEQKSWRTSEDNPQLLFKDNLKAWKGKVDEELVGDREFLRYKVLVEAWPEVQYKKGTWHRPGMWKKLFEDEEKKRAAINKR